MLAILAWSIVAASLLVIGVFGFASIHRRPEGVARRVGRVFLMAISAMLSALVLTSLASQLFMMAQIDKAIGVGDFREEDMQPDMPNLIARLLLFGWMFFLAGQIVARVSQRKRSG